MTSWLRGRSDTGAYEARTDVSSFILYAVLTLTVFVTAGYLVGIALLAHFDLLPRRLTTPIHFGGATTIIMAASITALLSWVVGHAVHDLSVSRAEARRLSRIDRQTGLLNREAFVEAVQAVERGFLVLFDVDELKAVNERHGRIAGDGLILTVAQALSRTFHAPHCVGRVGDEEFGVIFLGTDYEDCLLLVEEARRSIAEGAMAEGGRKIAATVSAGIANLAPEREISVLFEAADRALYLARSLGYDRAVHETETETLLAPSRRAVAARRRK